MDETTADSQVRHAATGGSRRRGRSAGRPPSDQPEVIARNRLEDSYSASPALAGRELYLRGERSLYCLAEK
jgi:hypothetical protein